MEYIDRLMADVAALNRWLVLCKELRLGVRFFDLPTTALGIEGAQWVTKSMSDLEKVLRNRVERLQECINHERGIK